MKIFISHISEERELAQALKTWIEAAFVGQCVVFVSSDPASLPAGTRWLDKLDQELNGAKVMLVLCSPAALQRPWINFETGCAWTRKIAVIPVCHSGQNRGTLPVPISSFQALELDSADFESTLLAGIAQHLGFKRQPRIDFAAMREELHQALRKVKPPPPPTSTRVQLHDMPEECTQILGMIAESGRPTFADNVAQKFRITPGKALYFLEKLEEQDLAVRHLVMGGAGFSATSEGRRFLVERGLL